MSTHSTVQPWIVTRDTARLLDFVSAVFGGEEIARIATEDGGIGHAEISVGDSVLLAFDARPDWPDTPSLLRIFVADVDATFDRAVAAGARVVTAVFDSAWGDRGGRIRDLLGNIWWVMQHVEDVEPAEVFRRMGEPVHVEAMRVAQSTLDSELSGKADGWYSPPVI